MSELREKLELLSVQGTQIVPVNAEATKKYLYDDLTVLDSKASALMAFDGILIAAASFTVEKGGVCDTLRVIPLIVIIMALVAAGLCLLVAQVSYPFLGKVVMTPGRLDYSKELDALDGAVIWRTRFYQAAWWLSLIAVALFLILFGMSLKSHL